MKGFFIILILFFSLSIHAQLKADFIIPDNTCAPTSVKFQNTSAGVSSTTIWEWELGNGNTSNNREPSAIYTVPGEYTIILRVTDGDKRDTIQKKLIIAGTPEVNFTVDNKSKCMPAAFTFTGTASVAVESWHWDFGDGTTGISRTPTITHQYKQEGKYTISATAVSTGGCSNSLTQKQLVTVLPAVQALFSVNKTFSCAETGTFQFTNESSGAGNLTYLWDFGDGKQSTEKSPAHTYNKKGVYSVKLNVYSSIGCEQEYVLTNLINVADNELSLTGERKICSGVTSTYTVKYTKITPSSVQWFVNDVLQYTWGNNLTFNYLFSTPGEYFIKAIVTTDECNTTMTVPVTISSIPEGVIEAVIKESCEAPFITNYNFTGTGITKWNWTINDQNFTEANPIFSQPDGIYINTYLVATNADGCSNTFYNYIHTRDLKIRIENTDNLLEFCSDTYKVRPRFITENPGATFDFLWDFGDGYTSTDRLPEHTYTQFGEYKIKLHYKTPQGCEGIVEAQRSIILKPRPDVDFSYTVGDCGFVTFQNLSGFDEHSFFTIDGTILRTNYRPITHVFDKEGTHKVKLTITDETRGACNTLEKEIVINSTLHEAYFDLDEWCLSSGKVQVFNRSDLGADSYRWDFGDGNIITQTSFEPKIEHAYQEPGNYIITLTVQKDNCISSWQRPTYFLQQKEYRLTVDNNNCNNSYNFKIETEGDIDNMPISFEYEGVFLSALITSLQINNNTIEGTIRINNPLNIKIRALIGHPGTCHYATNFVTLPLQNKTPSFSISPESCFSNEVIFTDNTPLSAGRSISKREWSFDNRTWHSSTSPMFTHQFSLPGTYLARLRLTDDLGCVTESDYQQFSTLGVKAAFNFNTPVYEGEVLTFDNHSIGYSPDVTYTWTLGDGTILEEYSIQHVYAKTGLYNVQLLAADNVSGCIDIITIPVEILKRPSGPVDPIGPVPKREITSTQQFISKQGSCPPVNARFSFSSNTPYTQLIWNLGDGVTIAGTATEVNRIFYTTGKHYIQLDIYDNEQHVGSITDSIEVKAPPTPTFSFNKNAICQNDTINFNLPGNKYSSYLWDKGDGNLAPTADSTYQHAYNTSGTYLPQVLVKDEHGCAFAIENIQPIVVHTIPVPHIMASASIACKEGVTLTATGGTQYEWSPAESLSNATIADPIARPVTATTYEVKVSNDFGCTDKASIHLPVASPISLSPRQSAPEICAGDFIEMNATGASSYTWINNTEGLINITHPQQRVSPTANTTYQLVGYDEYGCYTDTAYYSILVHPLPTVDAGENKVIAFGTSIQLQPTYSSDVIQWRWSPADILSCTTCPSPSLTATKDVQLQLEVRTQKGCSATDEVSIKTFCNLAGVAIPTAFSPNGDGKNDIFTINGTGFGQVKSLRIYSRWGDIIFYLQNFPPNNRQYGWNGKANGRELDTGAYVYVAEIECETGQVSEFKGTVMLIR